MLRISDKKFSRAALTVQFRFRQKGMRNPLFDKLRSLFGCCGAMDRPFLDFAVMYLAGLFGEAAADVLEIFLDVLMHPNQHLFEFSRR